MHDDLELLSVSSVLVQFDSSCAEHGRKARFFKMPAIEQSKYTITVARLYGPMKAVPQRPRAILANNRSA